MFPDITFYNYSKLLETHARIFSLYFHIITYFGSPKSSFFNLSSVKGFGSEWRICAFHLMQQSRQIFKLHLEHLNLSRWESSVVSEMLLQCYPISPLAETHPTPFTLNIKQLHSLLCLWSLVLKFFIMHWWGAKKFPKGFSTYASTYTHHLHLLKLHCSHL